MRTKSDRTKSDTRRKLGFVDENLNKGIGCLGRSSSAMTVTDRKRKRQTGKVIGNDEVRSVARTWWMVAGREERAKRFWGAGVDGAMCCGWGKLKLVLNSGSVL